MSFGFSNGELLNRFVFIPTIEMEKSLMVGGYRYWLSVSFLKWYVGITWDSKEVF